MTDDKPYTVHEHDVLVVGAGGAGLRAAIEASRKGARVAMVMKSLLGKAHTVMAEGGAAAALRNVDPRDNWKVHFRDTLRGGKFLNNVEMARLHAKEAPDRVRELEQWGAVFDRTKTGWINQRNFGGHTYPRLAHVGDRTGLEIIRTLQDKGVHQGIDVFMETTVVKLFKDDEGRVSAALAYDRDLGRFHLFRAKATILATGGIGKCWRITSNSWEYTGDGHTLAYDAGAELIDMEFVQFHPTGMMWPPSVKGTLVTEGVRGEGGVLRNSDGERFMFDNIPELFQGEYAETEEEGKRWLDGDDDARRPPELLTRDVVARAILKQVKEGRGTPHGGAWLDISWRPDDYIRKKLPSMYHQFKELARVDITKEPMEVGPTCHYAMGGVRVDAETAMSTVPGLFAAGEVAAGLHGANRLGGNSLTDLLVFGQRAGASATAYAAELDSMPAVDSAEVDAAVTAALAPLGRSEGENPYALQESLQEVMHNNVNMVRNGEDLEQAVQDIAALRERAAAVRADGSRHYNPGWHTALDLPNIFTTAEMVARAALMREESRGAHTRSDYPESSEEWGGVNVIVRKGKDGQMEVTTEALSPWPDDLRKIIEGTAVEISTPAGSDA